VSCKTCSRFYVFVIVRPDRRVADTGIVDENINAAEGGYGLVQGSANAVIVGDVQRIYLAAAAGLNRSKRLDLVHAAAALYGTAALTTSEMRLLRHLELLRYQL
jgi:hypothetical protein